MEKIQNKPALLIMAAGMGSRYGGLKQIDPIGPGGEVIIDYSIYDALQAGFGDIICVIKKANETAFRQVMEKGAARHANIKYAFQDLTDLPEGFSVPEGREKPWGTGHALYAARKLINGPFLVINADDYYGKEIYKTMQKELSSYKSDELANCCMAAYRLENTVSENGSVARGVCKGDGFLSEITETLGIYKKEGKLGFDKEDGSFSELAASTPVSMNMFGFPKAFMAEIEGRFPAHLGEIQKNNPLKGEYFLPSVVKELMAEQKARVKMLPCAEKWHGVTYKEDKAGVTSAIREMINMGLYPERLWK